MTRILFLILCNCALMYSALSQTVLRQNIGAMAASSTHSEFYVHSAAGQPFVTISNYDLLEYRPGFVQPLRTMGDILKQIHLNIYPNPVSHFLYIDPIPVNDIPFVEVFVYDLMGNMVTNVKLEQFSSTSIDCSFWASGMYMLLLKQGELIQSRIKFLKI